MGGRFRTARLSLGVLAALALPAAGLAATLNVNSTADQLIAGNGQCTLREAIINANGDADTTGGDCPPGSGADLINVPAGTYTLTIPGTNENAGATGDLDITGDLTLRGASAATTALVQATATSDPVVQQVGVGRNVVIERLRVTGSGDGIWGAGQIVVSDAIISESGFGIYAGGVILRRSAVINNSTGVRTLEARVEGSTISGNGIGIYSWSPFDDRYLPVWVSNSTIADNPILVGSDSSYRGALLDNLGGCPGGVSGGYNLDSDGGCGFTDPTDLSNVDPLLGPLQFNGGPTPTHALQLGSPAIDAIPSAACTYDHDGNPGTPEVALTRDQRGGMRPREGNGSAPSGCDIGAYEVTPCADGLDNDGDGLVDFDGGATAGLTPLASPDPTCTSALGAAEAAPPSSGCGVGPELLLLGALLAAVRRRPALAGSPDTRK